MSADVIAVAIVVAFVLLVLASGFIRGHRRRGATADEHWPLEARPVLTEREQACYQRLVAVCPDYIVLAQVALSQLIRVRYGTRNWRSIFGRYSQLVADFVICRKDFTVVAVIELDDSSHARPDRQDADRRKTKAVEAAGLRLIRIPAGPLPSKADLQALVGMGVTPSASLALTPEPPSPVLATDSTGSRRPLLIIALVLGAIGVGGVWWGATTLPGLVGKGAKQAPARPVAHEPVTVPKPVAPAPPPVDAVAVQAAEQKRIQAEQVLAAQQAADDFQRRKQAAWAEYYKAPASCEHPPAWQDQVECGNKYIRAKREFEKRWAVQNGLPVPQ